MKCEGSSFVIREAQKNEWNEAMGLALKIFMKFDSKDYAPRGTESFVEFINNEQLHKMFIIGSYVMFVALKDDEIVGMITLRSKNHISLLFVEEEYHRKGIGKKLVDFLSGHIKQWSEHVKITVNSSPYALEFYHKVGFVDNGIEQINDGICYTPMEKRLT